MSIMKCDSCDRCIDTDYNVEGVAVWAPNCICDTCFEKMGPDEVWNTALFTIAYEMKHSKDLHKKIEELMR